MCLCLKKTFAFHKQLAPLNMSGYCCFPGFNILPVRMHLTACLVLCLVMIFLLKLTRLKMFFHSPSELGQVLLLTLKLIVMAKRTKLILHMELFKTFIFQHGLNLKLFFCQIKGSSHEINLLCNRKCKDDVEENGKVLVQIIDTIVIL